MKTIGAVLIGVGFALVLFFVIRHFQSNKSLLSPIPNRDDIKVIIISPTD